jgi:hypothetical protein
MDENPYKAFIATEGLGDASLETNRHSVGWLPPTALISSTIGYLTCILTPGHFGYFGEQLALCFFVCMCGSNLLLLLRLLRTGCQTP